ncbi:MAG: hypothetical protein M3Y91_01145 [Actinomycetota bacterium]|nr:hypothetical protein [Actinomycetota bacterium]
MGAAARPATQNPDSQMESAGERRTASVAVVHEGVEVRGGHGRGDGHANRTPEVWEVLIKPAATPASRSVIPVRAPMEMGDAGESCADSGDEERAGQVGPEVPVGRGLGCPQHPGADEGHAEGHDRLGRGGLVTSLWERPAKAREVTEAVIQPTPARAEKPSTLLHVEGAQEHEGEEAGPEQETDGVRPGHAAKAEEAKGQEGRVDLGPNHEERGEQNGASCERNNGLCDRPADLGCLGDGVDEVQHGTSDRDAPKGS